MPNFQTLQLALDAYLAADAELVTMLNQLQLATNEALQLGLSGDDTGYAEATAAMQPLVIDVLDALANCRRVYNHMSSVDGVHDLPNAMAQVYALALQFVEGSVSAQGQVIDSLVMVPEFAALPFAHYLDRR